MAADRDAQLCVLLPSGGQGALRASHDSDTEGDRSYRRPDRLDKHDSFLDPRGDDGRRGIPGGPFFAQVDNHALADCVVAYDDLHGLHRRLRRRALLPLNCHGRRRVVLRSERLRSYSGPPQGDAVCGAFHPSGRALCGAYGLWAYGRMGTWLPRHVAQRLHRLRRSGLCARCVFYLGFEG